MSARVAKTSRQDHRHQLPPACLQPRARMQRVITIQPKGPLNVQVSPLPELNDFLKPTSVDALAFIRQESGGFFPWAVPQRPHVRASDSCHRRKEVEFKIQLRDVPVAEMNRAGDALAAVLNQFSWNVVKVEDDMMPGRDEENFTYRVTIDTPWEEITKQDAYKHLSGHGDWVYYIRQMQNAVARHALACLGQVLPSSEKVLDATRALPLAYSELRLDPEVYPRLLRTRVKNKDHAEDFEVVGYDPRRRNIKWALKARRSQMQNGFPPEYLPSIPTISPA